MSHLFFQEKYSLLYQVKTAFIRPILSSYPNIFTLRPTEF
jgi:hypothetical protein